MFFFCYTVADWTTIQSCKLWKPWQNPIHTLRVIQTWTVVNSCSQSVLLLLPQMDGPTQSFLTCAGVPSEPDADHILNLKGLISAALDVYSFMVRQHTQTHISHEPSLLRLCCDTVSLAALQCVRSSGLGSVGRCQFERGSRDQSVAGHQTHSSAVVHLQKLPHMSQQQKLQLQLLPDCVREWAQESSGI